MHLCSLEVNGSATSQRLGTVPEEKAVNSATEEHLLGKGITSWADETLDQDISCLSTGAGVIAFVQPTERSEVLVLIVQQPGTVKAVGGFPQGPADSQDQGDLFKTACRKWQEETGHTVDTLEWFGEQPVIGQDGMALYGASWSLPWSTKQSAGLADGVDRKRITWLPVSNLLGKDSPLSDTHQLCLRELMRLSGPILMRLR